MRVLVTGATGFLGGHVVRALLAQGHEVRALVRPRRPHGHLVALGADIAEGDLLDEPSLHRACAGLDALVNCAGIKSLWSRRNDEQWRVNVDGFAAAVRAATARKLKRIVQVSSAGAVGATRDGTLTSEGSRWIGPTHRIHYVTTKKEADERAFAAAWAGLPIVMVNPSFLLGPSVDGRPASSLAERVAAGRVRWIPPGGVSVADVEDAAWGLVAALERGRLGERYLLAGHNRSWAQLYSAIAHTAGVAPPRWRIPIPAARAIEFAASALDSLGLSRPATAPEIARTWRWTAYYDSSKARIELGYCTRPLEETLQRTLASFRGSRPLSWSRDLQAKRA